MNGDVWQHILVYIIFLWTILWKGVALWRAAHLKQRNWFIAILILNSLTLGLLELIYLFVFAKKKLTVEEMKGWKEIFVKRVPEKK